MNRIERLTGIVLLLQEKRRTSVEIAHHFEVSKRTVLRDIQALCEIGVPIIAQAGPDGGYSLPADYSLAPLALTTNQAFLLLLSLDLIARLSDVPFRRERASLLAKLRALLPQPPPSDIEQLLAVASMDVPVRDQSAPFLEPLLEATRQQRWVQITYQSTERLSTQHLLPRQITMHSGYWYCCAYSFERQEERTYRVDRIRTLAPAGEQFQAMPAPEGVPYEHTSHPEVVVRLTARGVAYIESEVHLGHRVLRNPDGTGYISFRCPPGELDWFARYFAGFGAEAQVCAPQELCDRLARIGQILMEHYRQR
jgi:predicted DNA-binding transcriptional regulator YafY